jgi:hypothetical protein
MFHFEYTLFNFVREYAHRLTRDIDESRFNHVAVPGTNTPQWILGHLVLGHEYALNQLSSPRISPREWFVWFGPGSSVAKISPQAPGKGELLAAFDTTHAAVIEAMRKVPEERLREKHAVPAEFLRQLTPTVGELVAHLLTTHPATHLGQLSFWRRAMGLPEVLV